MHITYTNSFGISELYTDSYESEDERRNIISYTNDGNLEKLEEYLKAGKKFFNVCDDELNSLLHIASARGHKAIVQFLLSLKEIDPLLANKKGLSALHIAAMEGKDEIVSLLLHHLDVNILCTSERTPLLMAAWKGHTKTVNLLLANGADSKLTCVNGYTVLHNACSSKNIDTVSEILNKGLVNVNYQSKSGSTPLMTAAIQDCGKIVELLIKHGARHDIIDLKGRTAYIRACKLRCKTALSILKTGNRESIDYSKEYLSRKLLAHVFQIIGTSRIPLPTPTIPKEELLMSLEGLAFPYAWSKIAKYTRFFFKSLPVYTVKDWHYISGVCEDEITPYSNPANLLCRYKNNKPIIVLTGYFDHIALAVLYQSHLIICDTGGYSERALTIIHIDQTAIDQSLISKLQALNHGTEDNYMKFYSRELPTAARSEIDQLKGFQPFLQFPMQAGGHCSTVSIEAAFFGVLTLGKAYERLHASKTSISPEELKIIGSESRRQFSAWQKFIRTYILEKYKMEKPSTKSHHCYPKDEELIKKCKELLSRSDKSF